MKAITILLLMISLTSCKDKIVCAQVESSKIKNLILKDLSLQFNRCRVRCFNLNSWKTLPLNKCDGFEGIEGEQEDYPIGFCEGLSGFDVSDMAKHIRPKIKELNAIKEDNCKLK